MDTIKKLVVEACLGTLPDVFEVELSRPEEQFGDFSTNVALKLAGITKGNPRQIAEVIAVKLRENNVFSQVTIAGPGFINLSLADNQLLGLAAGTPATTLAGQSIIVEYSDPNPFKELHVGHLYDCVVGESIALLCEKAGGNVHRVNFGGDVGLHVGKSMWAVLQHLGGEKPEELAKVAESDRPKWLASVYVEGSNAYEEDESAKASITMLNARVYDIHAQNDHESPLARIYWETRQWSYDYFDAFYARIGTKFEKYYPESATVSAGVAAVKEQLSNGIFEESDGAVVFKGEVHSLHTRVFINSNGLPTYETKDIGLALSKWQDYHSDRNIILTGNDIVEYMKVILAALGSFEPEIAARTTHLTHGMVKLAGGTKMSSRKGNVIRANDVLSMTADAIAAAGQVASESTLQAAIKYAFLKQRLGGDIIFDPKDSVSLEGNSGPYLQYAHARARSILQKSTSQPIAPSVLETGERSLVRKIGEFAEVVDRAVAELLPHHICTYLYELAQIFNRFYENNRVLDDPRQDSRLWLVQTYADTLRDGLGLLNINAPDKM